MPNPHEYLDSMAFLTGIGQNTAAAVAETYLFEGQCMKSRDCGQRTNC